MSLENQLNYCLIPSPLGELIAIANETHVCYLGYLNSKNVDDHLKSIESRFGQPKKRETSALQQLTKELRQYFDKKLIRFSVPVVLLGTEFQKKVWSDLMSIPMGTCKSYAQVAQSIDKPTAFRAVANANGANQIPIIVPCHRVIASDGSLGGYSGGIDKKEWLLNHERTMNPQ